MDTKPALFVPRFRCSSTQSYPKFESYNMVKAGPKVIRNAAHRNIVATLPGVKKDTNIVGGDLVLDSTNFVRFLWSYIHSLHSPLTETDSLNSNCRTIPRLSGFIQERRLSSCGQMNTGRMDILCMDETRSGSASSPWNGLRSMMASGKPFAA